MESLCLRKNNAVFNFKNQSDKDGKIEEIKKIKTTSKKETAIRAQKANGLDEKNVIKNKELLQNGEATTPPNADPETAIRERNNSLSQLDIPVASGTRRGAGSFGGQRYPKAINKTQDFIKFTMH